jgi:ABC-type multidrug transport system ATPase subunit
MNVIESRGLGKCYGSTWALRDCTLAVPKGHVVALVGSDGAGKTTLLNLAVGSSSPTAHPLGGLACASPSRRWKRSCSACPSTATATRCRPASRRAAGSGHSS